MRITLTTLVAAALTLAACGNNNDTPTPRGSSVPTATIEGPVTAGKGIILQGTTFPLADVGYMQEEYFVSGTARAFTNTAELRSDGEWDVEDANTPADYKTRIVVRRPIDDADFNGIVFVEWLNVSAGFDSGPD